MSNISSNRSAPAQGIIGRLEALFVSFKASSRLFKWRTTVVGAWVILSLLFVFLVISSGERNPIDADVTVRTVLGSNVVHIQNNGEEVWQDVRVSLPGGWEYERRVVRPSDRVIVSITDFERDTNGGTENPGDFTPETVTVSTSGGEYVWDSSRRR